MTPSRQRGGSGWCLSLTHYIVPSQIVAALSVPGVYSVDLQSPVERAEIDQSKWARCVNIEITVEGVAND